MDIRMPILNGNEAVLAIRQIEANRKPELPKVKIIALTTSLVDLGEEQFSLYGFDGFVAKPFTEDKIFEKMSEHLGLRYIYSANE
jgi:two-component system sensor histidine kinase/response regulator